MKQILIALTETLLAAANARAEQLVLSQAAARIQQAEAYSSNAGGWN